MWILIFKQSLAQNTIQKSSKKNQTILMSLIKQLKKKITTLKNIIDKI